MKSCRIYIGDVITRLRQLEPGSVRCCVTSPPYFALRNYGGLKGQIGLEPSPEAYLRKMVRVFREVRRVLAPDGTLWLNLGDGYNSYPANRGTSRGVSGEAEVARPKVARGHGLITKRLKQKDLMMMPARLALALQADGWYLRSDIIWHKPTPMPETVKDRPTTAHEHIFLLSVRPRYFYNADAIAEPVTGGAHDRGTGVNPKSGEKVPSGWDTSDSDHRMRAGRYKQNASFSGAVTQAKRKTSGNLQRKLGDERDRAGSHLGGSIPWTDQTDQTGLRNCRNVWSIQAEPFPGDHYATFPQEIPRRCLLAGSAPGDTVLDCFGGTGTTAAVAVGNGRKAVSIDLDPRAADWHLQRVGPMFCEVMP